MRFGIYGIGVAAIVLLCARSYATVDERNDPEELTKIIVQARANLDFESLAKLKDRNTLRVFRLSVDQMIKRLVEERGEELALAVLGLNEGWDQLEQMDHAAFYAFIMETVTLNMPMRSSPCIEIIGTVEKRKGRVLVMYRANRNLKRVPGLSFYNNCVEEFVDRNGRWYSKGTSLKLVERYFDLVSWRDEL